MSNDSINISRLFGYNRRVIKNNEILGYSDSEIEIGSARIKVKTLILYTKENEAFELIKYNYWNFGEVKIKLKKYTFLGFEPYNTGLYYRKYKFKNKPNKI